MLLSTCAYAGKSGSSSARINPAVTTNAHPAKIARGADFVGDAAENACGTAITTGLSDIRRSADGRFLTGGAIERAHRVVVEALLSQGLSVTEIGQALANTSPAARVG